MGRGGYGGSIPRSARYWSGRREQRAWLQRELDQSTASLSEAPRVGLGSHSEAGKRGIFSFGEGEGAFVFASRIGGN